MLNIKESDLKIILSIIPNLLSEINTYEVRAFGSRVNGTAKVYSDLDLYIIANSKIPLKTMALLLEDFQESNLTIRVDILDWQAISKEMQETLTQVPYEIILKK